MARQRCRPLQNTALQKAITAAGWTLAATADAVNVVGNENNIPLTYSASSVAHWLAGVTPRPGTVPVAVEAFARALDHPSLSAADLGWHSRSVTGAVDDPWDGDPVAWLMRIGRDDMNRRAAITTGLYSLAALTVPVAPHRILARQGRSRRAGPGDVTRIRETTRHLADIDDLYGGGHARAAVAAYLVADVAPLLRGTTGQARPDLFRAASELAYLAGYMAADGGENGLGQKYYVEASRLAEEAGDPLMRATVLRSLAIQAIELGHPREALDLAEAAVTGIRGGCPVRTRAWVTGAHAEALAAAADGRDAREVLRRAERDLERADSLPEANWTGNYRRESLDHQTGTLLASLGDLATAETHLAASLGSRRTIERRTRALVGTRLAGVQYRRGQLDAAKATLRQLRDDLAGVASARVRRELAAVPREVLPALS
jgi:tetratricopeptide (TPR) repeat protein